MTLNRTIDVWMRQWAKEFVTNRIRDIREAELVNTADLVNSLYARVLNEPDAGRFLMLFYAHAHGRYQDMRRRYTKAGGEEMIEALTDWAEAKGTNTFTKGKYSKRYEGKTPQKIANAVAWGITRKLKTIPATKKRSWYNRKKDKDIAIFYDLLIRLAQEAIVDELKTSFKTT